jgi:hypothetical protein
MYISPPQQTILMMHACMAVLPSFTYKDTIFVKPHQLDIGFNPDTSDVQVDFVVSLRPQGWEQKFR